MSISECRVPKNSKKRKLFLSEQCKDTEKNNRMGKTSDLFKKIRYTKGTFHAKMGPIKDRNGMDLAEAEGIKILRRGSKNTQNYTKKTSWLDDITDSTDMSLSKLWEMVKSGKSDVLQSMGSQ